MFETLLMAGLLVSVPVSFTGLALQPALGLQDQPGPGRCRHGVAYLVGSRS